MINNPCFFKENKDDFEIEKVLPEEQLSQLWLNCKIFIGEAILGILDLTTSDENEETEHSPEKILGSCIYLAKVIIGKIQLEYIPKSLEQFVSYSHKYDLTFSVQLTQAKG